MIVEEVKGDLVTRYSDDKKKMLHKMGTDEYYTGAVDLITSPYEYEEVDNPDYVDEDSDEDKKDE